MSGQDLNVPDGPDLDWTKSPNLFYTDDMVVFKTFLSRKIVVAVYSDATIPRTILNKHRKTFVLTLCILLHPDNDGFM